MVRSFKFTLPLRWERMAGGGSFRPRTSQGHPSVWKGTPFTPTEACPVSADLTAVSFAPRKAHQRGVGRPRGTGKAVALRPAGDGSGKIPVPLNGAANVVAKVSVPAKEALKKGLNAVPAAATPM